MTATRLAGFLLLVAPSAVAADTPLRQTIDAAIRKAWQENQLTPAAPATDAAFLRRVYLDLVGTIPSHDEAQSFLNDTAPDRRARLIESLLRDPRFARHQADVWDLTLFGRNPPNAALTRTRDSFQKWLVKQFADNVPYDRWVRELLVAEQGGPEMFHVQFRNDPEEATVAVTRTFLGTQLQCARCHDHPYERWKQRDFYGMAGFLARVVVIDAGQKGKERLHRVGEKSTGDVMFTGSVKEQKVGQKGEPVRPRFLGADADLAEPPLPRDFKEPDWRKVKDPPAPVFSRRAKLAEWVTSPGNPYFARAAVNRVWAQFMGRGLVHPVDDLSEGRVPSHPELLDALAREFIAHNFDLQWLICEIVSADAYALSSAGPGADAAPKWYDRARVRPLSAEEILASLRVATGFDAAARASGKDPAAVNLPGSLDSYALRYLGEPANGRGDFQASLQEHLLFNNGYQIRQMIQRQKGNLAEALLSSGDPWPQKIDRLFLSVLTRRPTDEERQKFVEYVTAEQRPDGRLTEAVWVLLNSAEFRFNH